MAADWFRSSYSAVNNECVEVAYLEPLVGIRDSKDPTRGMLAIDTNAFSLFLNNIKEELGVQFQEIPLHNQIRLIHREGIAHPVRSVRAVDHERCGPHFRD
ncbi:DUF397 domain-containing protein [Streptomyces ipomoeae]|nr:DUF397 domain-containing protein [Streptomyces ipomoeae]MDX2933173.1 DUF397 domain-containing protein [Streptomyces ipomoeae]TQE19860.1 DUF397 domain-containing protein [Streptomyces ipomoeae]